MTDRPRTMLVMPVFNQLHYTRGCLESFDRDGIPRDDVVVVDNASTDGTREFLAAATGLRVVSNEKNLGCSPAWNQGVEAALAAGAKWIVVINNDVVLGKGFLEGLVGFAERGGAEIVHPGCGEGELDYDVAAFSEEFVRKMADRTRVEGVGGGECFMVRRDVFERIGLFDVTFGLAGFEDVDFFRRARDAGFRRVTTGMAYLHHYGSVTQNKVKKDRGMAKRAALANREAFLRKHRLNWFRRRWEKMRLRSRMAAAVREESRGTGLTLRMRRADGRWVLG